MAGKGKLSTVIIAYNEAHCITRCIRSAMMVSDEVLVVDSGSTDRTVEIAENLGARVLNHPFEGHIQQKNWAKDQALYPFVLSLDADEFLSEELQDSIMEEKIVGFHHSGYYMNRLNYIGDRPIKGCGWYPDKKLRLWNRDRGQWKGINPHDRFRIKRGYPKKKIKGDLNHYSYENKRELWKKSINYGVIGAKYAKTLPWFKLISKVTFSPLVKFFKNYFIKKGIFYGFTGLIICLCQMVESYVKYGRGLFLKLGLLR